MKILIVVATDFELEKDQFSAHEILITGVGILETSLELTKNKVRVNCLSPGVIKESKLFKDYSKSITKNQAQAVIDSHPLRIGTFKDVNHAVEFLIGNESDWFTGQNFVLDGGYSSQ